MADIYRATKTDLAAVADAIREKGGTEDALTFPGGFVSAIQNIKGGSGLMLNLIGGTTQPANPTEPTIWVNTDTEITGYILSADEPSAANAASGTVWVRIGDWGAVEFDVLEDSTLLIRVCTVYQLVDGSWDHKPSRVYTGGAWHDLRTYMIKGGVFATGLAPKEQLRIGQTLTAALKDGYVNYYPASTSYSAGTRSSVQIDLTDYTSIVMDVDLTQLCTKATTDHQQGINILVTNYITGTNTTNIIANCAAIIESETLGRHTFSLDVTSLSGLYYIGTWMGANEGSRGNCNIYNMWLE